MENAKYLIEKMRKGIPCMGSVVSVSDPIVTEALCTLEDFVWIDMEHAPHTLQTVRGHIMATKGSQTAALVRVVQNDPALIKTVLDAGADGIIAPNVCTAEDARRLVAGCKYPPEGIRGFGPHRPSRFGQRGGPDFCREANETVIIIAQIEHIDAVDNIEEILDVPGLTSILFGPNDLAGSMGLMGQPNHPEVQQAIERVIARARAKGLFIGLGAGLSAEKVLELAARGIHWMPLADDYGHMLHSVRQVVGPVREKFGTH